LALIFTRFSSFPLLLFIFCSSALSPFLFSPYHRAWQTTPNIEALLPVNRGQQAWKQA